MSGRMRRHSGVNEWIDKEDLAMNEWKEIQRLRIEEGVDGNIAFLRELRTEVSEAFIPS